MYPQVSINIKKLRNNLDAVAKTTKEHGKCSMMVVTKCVCADEEVVSLRLRRLISLQIHVYQISQAMQTWLTRTERRRFF